MNKNVSMLEGKILPNVIRFTIPLILTSVLQLLFNAADLVVVGRYCGSNSVAAVGATSALTHLFVNLFIGLSVGSGVAVAHGIGRADKESVKKTVHTAIPASFLCGIGLGILGIILSQRMLTLMGTPDNILELSSLYMKIYFAGMPFVLLYNFTASILRAVGDTKSPLVFLTISGVINVVLNIIFVTVFDMNVAGVALATIISQVISAILVLITLMKRTDDTRFSFSKMGFHKNELLNIIRIGLPAGIQSSLFAISNVIIQSSVNSFGDVFMSGSAAAANIEAFVYVCINAFNQCALNFVAQNSGARKIKRVKMSYINCIVSCVCLSIFLGLFVFIFGEQLLSIYITDSEQAIAYGMMRLMYISLPYFLCAFMDVTTGALRGLGASVTPMVISILGVCGIRLLWVFTIFNQPQFHTPHCLFLSYGVSWTVTFIFEFIAFVALYKKAKATSID